MSKSTADGPQAGPLLAIQKSRLKARYSKHIIRDMLCKCSLKLSAIRRFATATLRGNKNHLQHFLRVLDLDRRGLGHRGTFGRLLFGPLDLCVGEVVYSGELNEGREDEGEADGDEPVHRSGI